MPLLSRPRRGVGIATGTASAPLRLRTGSRRRKSRRNCRTIDWITACYRLPRALCNILLHVILINEFAGAIFSIESTTQRPPRRQTDLGTKIAFAARGMHSNGYAHCCNTEPNRRLIKNRLSGRLHVNDALVFGGG